MEKVQDASIDVALRFMTQINYVFFYLDNVFFLPYIKNQTIFTKDVKCLTFIQAKILYIVSNIQKDKIS